MTGYAQPLRRLVEELFDERNHDVLSVGLCCQFIGADLSSVAARCFERPPTFSIRLIWPIRHIPEPQLKQTVLDQPSKNPALQVFRVVAQQSSQVLGSKPVTDPVKSES